MVIIYLCFSNLDIKTVHPTIVHLRQGYKQPEVINFSVFPITVNVVYSKLIVKSALILEQNPSLL